MNVSVRKPEYPAKRIHISVRPTNNCQDYAFAFGSNENKREGNTTREEQQCSS